MTEDLSDNDIKVLKDRINELEAELNKKESEISDNLDTIEILQDRIMKLEDLFSEKDGDKKSKKQKIIESKMALDLEEKEREIRDLKNRMGFLRKEKVQLQQELEKLNKKKSRTSIVINTEDLKAKKSLEDLVKELQDKVNKQKSKIHNLKKQYINKNEFNDKLKQQEKVIEKKLAFSMQKQIDNQKEIIQNQKETIENLQKENEKIRKSIDTLEIQLKIKDQRIEELKNQIKPKGKRK